MGKIGVGVDGNPYGGGRIPRLNLGGRSCAYPLVGLLHARDYGHVRRCPAIALLPSRCEHLIDALALVHPPNPDQGTSLALA
jgi:hypothetical protein